MALKLTNVQNPQRLGCAGVGNGSLLEAETLFVVLVAQLHQPWAYLC